jgi:hypothetical protein
LFQAGECWWVLSQEGKARSESLAIRRKSASDRDKPIESGMHTPTGTAIPIPVS